MHPGVLAARFGPTVAVHALQPHPALCKRRPVLTCSGTFITERPPGMPTCTSWPSVVSSPMSLAVSMLALAQLSSTSREPCIVQQRTLGQGTTASLPAMQPERPNKLCSRHWQGFCRPAARALIAPKGVSSLPARTNSMYGRRAPRCGIHA